MIERINEYNYEKFKEMIYEISQNKYRMFGHLNRYLLTLEQEKIARRIESLVKTVARYNVQLRVMKDFPQLNDFKGELSDLSYVIRETKSNEGLQNEYCFLIEKWESDLISLEIMVALN
ncbi:gp169 [Bacillus phage G]|uniref:Gp169 n=1 Tax=Bacillus phage G TaxID=2884420 RepID=G3MBN5_9CAUD|nr:gp169 [Bacillus phage G]AEO93429.1 gp169 [Bacillus phage G]